MKCDLQAFSLGPFVHADCVDQCCAELFAFVVCLQRSNLKLKELDFENIFQLVELNNNTLDYLKRHKNENSTGLLIHSF